MMHMISNGLKKRNKYKEAKFTAFKEFFPFIAIGYYYSLKL